MKKRITFSQLQRISICPSSQVLPWAEGESGDAADFGTRQHSRLEALNDYGTCDYQPGDVSLDGLVEPGMGAEEAFAINVNTGEIRFIGKLNKAREYPNWEADAVIYGTLDLWKPSVVKELKTGNGYIPPPKKNLQVRAQAYCSHRLGEKTRATICIRRADGYSQDIEEEFDDDDHETTLSLLQGIVRRVTESDGKDVHEGDHCTYCPAILSCPAKSSRIQALMSSPGETSITKDNARNVYLTLRAAKGFLEGIERDLRAYAMIHPVDLGNGKVYGQVEQEREYVEGATLYSYIKERWGADVALQAVNLSSSKALIDHVLPFLKVEKSKLLDDLRRAGVLKTSRVEQFREHKRKAS